MRIGVIGAGGLGGTLGSRLAELGHEVICTLVASFDDGGPVVAMA